MRPTAAVASEALRNSLEVLDDWHLTAFLTESARAIAELGTRAKRGQGPLRPSAAEVDLWALPDCLWQVILRRRPSLATFPLGEAVERGLKATLADCLARSGLKPGMRRAASEARAREAILESVAGPPSLLELFLGRFFFELCIDNIRRDDPGGVDRSAFDYHYSSEGVFRPLTEERAWRRRLLGHCRAWSRLFLPSLVAAGRAGDFATAQGLIAEGFERIIGLRPRAVGPGLPDPIFQVVAGAAEAPFDGPSFEGGRPLILRLGRPGGNVAMSADWLRRLCPGAPLHDLVLDLYELGVAVYFSGLLTPRQGHLGRRLELSMAMRRPKRWERVVPELESTLTILAKDDIHLSFAGGGEPTRGDRLGARRSRRPVCLFSGGLDSLAGAVHMLERGERPILISHYSNSMLSALQRRLVARLREAYGESSLDHFGVYVSRTPKRATDEPLPLRRRDPLERYLRPFMFLSLATAAAAHVGSRRIHIFESGPLALYPLFTEGQVRTRSVDPRFVAGFQGLARRALGLRLRIENPFLYRTKGEILSLLASDKTSHLVALSNSCWSWAQLKAHAALAGRDATQATHDGQCLPCLLRRASVHAADLSALDAGYMVNVFEEFSKLGEEDRLTLADYFRFCENVRTLGAGRLLEFSPDFSVCAPGVDGDRLVRMFRRSARELRACLEDQGSAELKLAFGL